MICWWCRCNNKARSVLLPGDAEKQAEYAMLGETEAGKLRADVLKVGHHGSKDSTMPECFESVGPQIAIISAGEHGIRVSCFAACPAEAAVSGNVKAPDHDEGNQ
jgi:hypothetical protein